MQTTVYIATSVDGFIARENGDIDWLPSGEDTGVGEDYGYQELLDSVDVLVMGRHTYEKVLSFGAWPYGEKSVVVLSHRHVHIPDAMLDTVSSMSGSPRDVVRQLDERGFHHLYIDGGKTIQDFLGAGLIDALIITTIPILIGSGLSLFGPLPHDVSLRHLETRHFDNGLVQTKYEVVGNAS